MTSPQRAHLVLRCIMCCVGLRGGGGDPGNGVRGVGEQDECNGMHLIPVGHSKPEDTCLELEIGSRKMREQIPEGRLLARRDLGVTQKIWPRIQLNREDGLHLCFDY
jgi:hypothetical protein